MGNQNNKRKEAVDIDLSHPKFTVSTLVKVGLEVHLQTKILAEEKDYKKWVAKF
jgi:hypothetical protein